MNKEETNKYSDPNYKRDFDKFCEENQESSNESWKEELKKIAKGRYNCSRVWEAWQVGTMTQDDFSPLEEDEDFVSDISNLFSEARTKAVLKGERNRIISQLREEVKSEVRNEMVNIINSKIVVMSGQPINEEQNRSIIRNNASNKVLRDLLNQLKQGE